MPEGIMSLTGGPQPPMTAGSPEMFNPAQMSQEEALGIIFQSFDSETISSMRSAREELRGLEPEQLADLSDIIDYMIANPDEYEEIRAQMISEGAATEEDLPPTFDANFLQMFNGIVKSAMMDEQGNIGTPDMGQAQGFAMGGAVTLDQMANLGRGGDTMAAHITPGEAFLLRERGGSGTINPVTGQPEFIFKSIGRAVSSVGRAVGRAVSSVGRAVGSAVKSVANFVKDNAPMILSVGLSFTPLGPIAGAALGAGLGTMIQGGSPSDALRAAAMGGITGAAFSGIGGMVRGEGFMAGVRGGLPAGMQPTTAAQQALAESAAPVAETSALAPRADMAPTPLSAAQPTPLLSEQLAEAAITPTVPPDAFAQTAAPTGGVVSGVRDAGQAIIERATNARTSLWDRISPNRGMPTASDVVASPAFTELTAAGVSPDVALTQVQQSMTPGAISRFGPLTAVGVGGMALAGGFQQPPPPGPLGVAPTQTGWELADLQNPELAAASREFYSQPIQYGQFAGPTQVETPTSAFPSLFEMQPVTLPPSQFSFGMQPQPLRMASGGVASLMGRVVSASASRPERAEGSAVFNVPGPFARVVRTALNRLRPQVAPTRAPMPAENFNPQYTPFNPMAAVQAANVPSVVPGVMPEGFAQRMPGIADALRQRMQERQGQRMEDRPIMSTYGGRMGAQEIDPVTGLPVQGMFLGGVIRGTPVTGLQTVANQLPSDVPTGAFGLSPGAAVGSVADAIRAVNAIRYPERTSLPQTETPTTSSFTFNIPQVRGFADVSDRLRQRMQERNQSMMEDSPLFSLYGGRMGAEGFAQGGAPRMVGAINGPGTETSDSIPAYLSDGEFVFTARAVRGAGRGDRNEGIRAMYNLMNNLERMA